MNSKHKNNEPALPLENEIWVKLKMNDAYEISNLGRLKHTFKNGKVKIVKPSSNGGKRRYQFYMVNDIKVYVHHLVLFTFIGKKPNGHECDHIDNNPKNNNLSNLRWITIGENRSHLGEKHPSAKVNNDKVRLIRMLWEHNKNEVGSQKKLSELFGISPSTLSSIINRKTWSHI